MGSRRGRTPSSSRSSPSPPRSRTFHSSFPQLSPSLVLTASLSYVPQPVPQLLFTAPFHSSLPQLRSTALALPSPRGRYVVVAGASMHLHVHGHHPALRRRARCPPRQPHAGPVDAQPHARELVRQPPWTLDPGPGMHAPGTLSATCSPSTFPQLTLRSTALPTGARSRRRSPSRPT